jgi:hypothetical protein
VPEPEEKQYEADGHISIAHVPQVGSLLNIEGSVEHTVDSDHEDGTPGDITVTFADGCSYLIRRLSNAR